MKLLKKILAVFTFLFVFTVMAVNMGVNAITQNGTYELVSLMDASYNPGSTNITQPADHGIFKSFISSKYRFQNAGTDWTGGDADIADYSYNFQLRNNGAGFSITIELGEGQSAQLNYVFFAVSEKKLTIGDTQIASSGTNTLVSGNMALSTGSTAVVGTGNVDILKFEVVISGGEEKTFFDVKYYDSDKTSEFTLLADRVEENGKATKPQDPKKLGYTFDKWLNMEDDSIFEFENETISTNINLYASYTNWENVKELSLETVGLANDKFGTTESADTDRSITGTIYSLLKGKTKLQSSVKTVASLGTSIAAINTGGTFSSTNIKNGIKVNPVNNGILSMYVYYNSDRACTMLRQDDSTYTEISSGQSTGEDTITLVKYPLEAGKSYYFGSSAGSIYIYYANFENAISTDATINGGISFGTSTVDGTKAVRFVGSLVKEGITASDITSVTATISISGSSKDVTVKDVTTTVDTSIGTLAAEAENTLYFYTSVYGFEDTTLDTRVLTVVFDVTFTDGSVISKTLTYTINYAEM